MTLHVLSLGAGVQSSALLIAALNGELPDDYGPLDGAVFADTGDEPAVVYEWLEVLTDYASSMGLEITTVRHPSGRSLSDWSTRDDAKSDVLGVPMHIRKPDGTHALARRSCTREFKIKPVRRHLRTMWATQPSPRAQVQQLIGISIDEYQRMRDSAVKYIANRYPLVEMRWNRNDCAQYVHRMTGHVPPRSACVYCPYRPDQSWLTLTDAEMAQAVAYEEAARQRNATLVSMGVGSYLGELTLHRRGRLADVTLGAEAEGQQDLFGDECEGMCGV